MEFKNEFEPLEAIQEWQVGRSKMYSEEEVEEEELFFFCEGEYRGDCGHDGMKKEKQKRRWE